MNAVPVTLPGTPLAAMLLTGAANLLPAATCMFMALMGGNGVALGGTALDFTSAGTGTIAIRKL